MKKSLAHNINKDNEEINKQVETTNVKMKDIANKLLKDDHLSLEDIQQLGQCLAEQQGYDKKQLFVCDVTELSGRLVTHSNETNETPIFIICHDKNVTNAAFCVVKLMDRTVCLYKDFRNIQIPEGIENILEQHFGKNIEFKIPEKTEEIGNKKDTDILFLTTVKTMMVSLKSDKKMDFIEYFANPKKTYFGMFKDMIVGFKKELFSLVKDSYYQAVLSDIDQLSSETDFKKAFNKLINSVQLIEEVGNFKKYQNLLKEFVDIEENENDSNDITNKIKELEIAREKVFSKTKQLKLEITQNQSDLQLDIVKKFPTQMEKITRIFEPLVKSEVDEKLYKTLKGISTKLDVDYDKLKSFFGAKEEKKIQDDNNNNAFGNKNIEDVIRALPKFQSKDANLSYENNKPLEKLLSEINVKSLRDGYTKVKGFHKSWENRKPLEIYQWAVSKQGHLDVTEIYEALAIMDRANELVTGGHRLRDTQILSVLTFLQQKDKGLLSQIQTGEGKTTIVAILAAIKALQGETVDVVTSNPILASDGIKEKHLFYNLLSLSATTNNLYENYKNGERECYKANIVYGSISNFQFDYLKDSFLGLKTRAGRSFECIILDEVDSMIIDNASHIAKLAGPLPGMESLKYVYIKIWQQLYKAEESLIQEFQKKLKVKAQELQTLADSEAQATYENFENELKNSVVQRIKDYIKSTNPTKIDIIPSHIQNYADNSLERWIDSAIEAKFNYHEDEQYVIRDKNGEKVVQPVDYANTGITLKNTMWQYGLHQFLQLKHNLHVTSESLTSCFISNLGYINKYGDKIFGLTGTLGSETEQELLSSIYNVGYAKIPTYREKKFIEIDGEVMSDEDFCKKVADDAISEADNFRSSLIICETIKDAKTIQDELKKRNEDIVIKTFFYEENVHVTEENINSGEVVIATNIAGRGTDFKTSAELENNGGLHVCIAFLPCNKRVEDQAFGRTARQGNKGTGKLVIKRSEIEKLGIDSYNFKTIKSIRDIKEIHRIEQIKNVKVLELEFQDRLFEHFSTLYRNLKKDDQSDGECQYVLDDLKEFWAFWLEKMNFKRSELADKNSEKEFKAFKSEACETIKGKITFNPYYSIQQAEHFILNEKLDKAEDALHHAIKISKNPEILHSAYVKLFEIAIEKGGVIMDKFKKAVGDVFVIPSLFIEPDREYKENAKQYLKKAKDAFKKEFDYIEQLFEAEEFTNIIKSDVNTEVNKKDCTYWFSDKDMHDAGEQILSSLGINSNVQFRNRVTKDQIETFCKEHQLEAEKPVFICYNIGSTTNQGGGIHWVAMCIVKIQDRIKLLYKDSKGDFTNNSSVVKNEFAKYYNNNLDFILHAGSEQKDNYSCGPMTLENLRIMAMAIQKEGVEKFSENFTSLKFSQQQNVSDLRNKFADMLLNESQKIDNFFIKHIISKQQALSLNMDHTDSLIQQIDEHKGGISVSGRISDYFLNLKPQNDNENEIKSTITNSELSELAIVGTNTTYALREVHDVSSQIVTAAQIQIGGGIALIAAGICFPPALPVTSSIGGTMITEGLCDIAIELINKNSDGQFNKEAYIKGKVISYGVSLLTMGISAAMQCPKILNAAKKACRWISETLRKCPFLLGVCEVLATKFDKLGDWFEKLETIAKFMKMSQADKLKFVQDLEKCKNLKQLKYLGKHLNQIPLLNEFQKAGKLTELTHIQTCVSTLQQVAIRTGKSVTSRIIENVVISKVVTPTLTSLMSELKPTIKKHVDKSVRKYIDKNKLKTSSYEDIQNVMKKIRDTIDYDTIKGIFKDTVLALTKHCSNWKVQLFALAFDQFDSWKELYNYTKDLCEKINDNLTSTAKTINNDVEELMNQLIEQFSEEVYSQFISTTINTCKDVYSVGKSAYANYQQEKHAKMECLAINKDFKEGGQAGQEQAYALSDEIKKPICIIDENGNKVTIGMQYSGSSVELSYFPPDENNPLGHYVPYGEDRNWSLGNGENNNCLFGAVGSQIGEDSGKLRQNTETRIEGDPTRYIVPHLTSKKMLMPGGATRKRTKKIKDPESSESTETRTPEGFKYTEKKVRSHLESRLLNFVSLGGLEQRVAENSHVDRDNVVKNERSAYQDRSCSKTSGNQAAHVVRGGEVNPGMNIDDQNEIKNFLGHTHSVKKEANLWNGIGGDIDKFQEKNRDLLRSIDFSRGYAESESALKTITEGYYKVLRNSLQRDSLSPELKTEIQYTMKNIKNISLETIFKKGQDYYKTHTVYREKE